MKQSARLSSTIEILTLQGLEEKPLDQICHTYFKNRRYIGSKDRQAISALVYGIMRHRGSCDWWALERGLSPLLMGAEDAARIRVLSYLWLFEKTERDEIGILFSGDKYAPNRLTDKEKSIFVKLPEREVVAPWVEGEFPEWAYPLLRRRFGEDITQEMKAFLTQAPLDLRVNSLKGTREEALKQLRNSGLSVLPTKLSSLGLRCESRENITQTIAFRDGLIEVQDEGSQLVADLIEAKPGEAVLDLCAGAGGKTLALAAKLQNKGRIVATDTAEWRLKRAKERLKRAGVFNVELRELSSLQDKWLKRQNERFDHVLIDAPCSGSGTWRRNPDQKWNIGYKDIHELAELQKNLLNTAADIVKKGGSIVYATCSLFCEENQDVAESFLAQHPEFMLVEPYLSLSPYKNGTDGFFAAKFVKVQS